jgi:DNA processing protein
MTAPAGADRLARAALTYLAAPADPLLGELLQVLDPSSVLASIRSGAVPAGVTGQLPRYRAASLSSMVARWNARMPAVPADAVARHEARGIQLLCPDDPGWPPQLDDLGTARPLALWVRGTVGLRSCCAQSIAVIGARAATAYGEHASTEIAAALGEEGWAVISGGARGIDACAHRAALAAGGRTVAVLACGPDVDYPRDHRDLFAEIAAHGAVISESPPETRPDRPRFLLRNRIIAALASGTVVVEAARRSGTISAAGHAEDLRRPLMAVPGPITSAMSAGCHDLMREHHAACVTSGAEVIAEIPPF